MNDILCGVPYVLDSAALASFIEEEENPTVIEAIENPPVYVYWITIGETLDLLEKKGKGRKEAANLILTALDNILVDDYVVIAASLFVYGDSDLSYSQSVLYAMARFDNIKPVYLDGKLSTALSEKLYLLADKA